MVARDQCFRLAGLLVAAYLLMSTGCSRDPYAYAKVSGKITYDDGTLIPASQIIITFVPQTNPKDAKTYPPRGIAQVNVADGTFDSVASHRYNDGIVRGRHKVTVVALDQARMPAKTVLPEYGDPTQSPLTVDTANSPFDLKIRKPR
jgi:hypothetical protein